MSDEAVRDNRLDDPNQRQLASVSKNKTTEIQVTAKRVTSTDFIDFREWWFQQGPDKPPIPTGRGCMVPRAQLPTVLAAILADLKDEELTNELRAVMAACQARVSR